MAEHYSERRVPLITVVWPGDDNSDSEPLRGIYHSAYDGTAQFEYVSRYPAGGDESIFPAFLHEFANALREYQMRTLLDEIEATEAAAKQQLLI